MDPISLVLGLAGLLVLGFGIFSAIRKNKDLPYEQRVAALLSYAPQVVAAALQLFKIVNTSDKDAINDQRKNYTMSLMFALAAQFKIPLSEDIKTLISSAIEAAVHTRKNL